MPKSEKRRQARSSGTSSAPISQQGLTVAHAGTAGITDPPPGVIPLCPDPATPSPPPADYVLPPFPLPLAQEAEKKNVDPPPKEKAPSSPSGWGIKEDAPALDGWDDSPPCSQYVAPPSSRPSPPPDTSLTGRSGTPVKLIAFTGTKRQMKALDRQMAQHQTHHSPPPPSPPPPDQYTRIGYCMAPETGQAVFRALEQGLPYSPSEFLNPSQADIDMLAGLADSPVSPLTLDALKESLVKTEVGPSPLTCDEDLPYPRTPTEEDALLSSCLEALVNENFDTEANKALTQMVSESIAERRISAGAKDEYAEMREFMNPKFNPALMPPEIALELLQFVEDGHNFMEISTLSPSAQDWVRRSWPYSNLDSKYCPPSPGIPVTPCTPPPILSPPAKQARITRYAPQRAPSPCKPPSPPRRPPTPPSPNSGGDADPDDPYELATDELRQMLAAYTADPVYDSSGATVLASIGVSLPRPPIVPNGARLDAEIEEGADFSLVADRTLYTLLLEGVDSVKFNPSTIRSYLVAAKLPMAESVEVHDSRAVIKFDSHKKWKKAAEHGWAFGAKYCPPDFDPSLPHHGAFYRLIYNVQASAVKGDGAAKRLLLGIKARTGITVISAKVTKNPQFVKVYARSLENFVSLATVQKDQGKIVIPATNSQETPIVLSPVLALAATNDPRVTRLQVGNLPSGVDEGRLLCRLRQAAEKAGAKEDDVLFFGVRKYYGSDKPGRFGFLFVRGANLADFFLATAINTKEGTLNIKMAKYEDSSSGKRKREE